MYNRLAINLGWSSSQNIKDDYYKWIHLCQKNNISFVRIFLCSWSINALYDKDFLPTLCDVIKCAYKNKIEVCLVLGNFVDYNINNYSDINNKKYSWHYNPYYKKYKRVKKFFKQLDKDYMDDVKNILDVLSKFSNVKYVEIMNEIDQVKCSNKILINWVNQIIKDLEKNFHDRYIYTCSISNHELFTKFKNNMNCYVDLHFYSFPYENAIKNIEYIFNKHDILYLGEYAKHSDNSYLNEMDSKIYFTSGLWGSYFYKIKYSPLHWWWKELLYNSEYIKIINVYKSITNKLGNISAIEKVNINYKIVGNRNKDLEKNKIKERLNNIFRHPLFILNELKSIKKFINKKMRRASNVVVRNILINNKNIYYLECNDDIIINEDFCKNYIIDLMSGVKMKYNKKISKGNYLIF